MNKMRGFDLRGDPACLAHWGEFVTKPLSRGIRAVYFRIRLARLGAMASRGPSATSCLALLAPSAFYEGSASSEESLLHAKVLGVPGTSTEPRVVTRLTLPGRESAVPFSIVIPRSHATRNLLFLSVLTPCRTLTPVSLLQQVSQRSVVRSASLW